MASCLFTSLVNEASMPTIGSPSSTSMTMSSVQAAKMASDANSMILCSLFMALSI